MTEEIKVLKVFEPFILGKCRCGCNGDLKLLRDKFRNRLKFYLPHHYKIPKQNKLEYRRVYKPNHPHADSKGCVRYHRLVMEQILGRYLKPWEVVDHINKDRWDNRPENLRLFSNNSIHIKNHKPKTNWSWRKCSLCGSSKTYIHKNGNPNWYDDKRGGNLCFNCWHSEYHKLIRGHLSLLSV